MALMNSFFFFESRGYLLENIYSLFSTLKDKEVILGY